MASIKLKGDTSGEITISAPAVAGTTTLELPATSSTLATQNALGVRNLIINGDMRIAQRGTSATGLTTTDYYTVDRWRFLLNTMGTWTMSQDTNVPSGQGFSNSIKIQCTTADASPAATDFVRLYQKIEAQNLQHLNYGTSSAEKVTFSFWIKSNKTGTYTLRIYAEDNARHIVNTYTIDTADTWEKKTITFNADTTGTINNDNGAGFQCDWWFGSGANYTSGTTPTDWEASTAPDIAAGLNVNIADSTSNYINITGVQLEVGDTATPFEHRPYDMELARCQRYFQVIKGSSTGTFVAPFYYNAATEHLGGLRLLQQMRASPSLTSSSSSHFSLVGNGGTITPSSTLSIDRASNISPTVGIQASAPATTTRAELLNLNTSTAYLWMSSEL